MNITDNTTNTNTNAQTDGSENGIRRVYTRDCIYDLPPTSDKSYQYSRSVARGIFARRPHVQIVEYVGTGCKTDSLWVGERGVYEPSDPEVHVYVASTGGKYGRSSREYYATPEISRASLTALRYFLLATEALPEDEVFAPGDWPDVGVGYHVEHTPDGSVSLTFNEQVRVEGYHEKVYTIRSRPEQAWSTSLVIETQFGGTRKPVGYGVPA